MVAGRLPSNKHDLHKLCANLVFGAPKLSRLKACKNIAGGNRRRRAAPGDAVTLTLHDPGGQRRELKGSM